ncbi:MAG: DUF5076 domain-containing protein [Porphyrobacter sp.]|nr:DUF5076 domain-containing protein [Porphyrobacter sp.]
MIGWRRKPAHPGAIELEGHPDLTDDYFELARFWVSAEQGRSYVLMGFLERWQPELLGSLINEGFHNAAAAYAERGIMSEEEALRRLYDGFDDHRASLNSEATEDDGR